MTALSETFGRAGMKPSPFKGEAARVRTEGSRAAERPEQERRAGVVGVDRTSEATNGGRGWICWAVPRPHPLLVSRSKGREKRRGTVTFVASSLTP